MTENSPKNIERPEKALVDLSQLVQWFIDNVSELRGAKIEEIPYRGLIDVKPVLDYVDSRIQQLEEEISPLEQFFEKVVKPSHRKMAKNTEELQKGVKIEEALEKIKDLTGEERKKALRKLILKNGDEE